MDDDFRILFDYVEQMKRELQDEADLQTKSDEDEEKKCVHESIETEEAYVCCKCGLVLEDIFQPDIHWCDHALMPRIYGGADCLNAMHKVLIKFLDKAKQKKVSASTNPTDRVLKRRPDTFFRLRIRYFLAPLRDGGQLRRRCRPQQRSRKVKIKQRA